MKNLILIFSSFLIISACKPSMNETDAKVETLLKQMTLDEKIGQMTQMCFSTITLDGSKSLNLNADLFKEAIKTNHVGSFLSGSDSAKKWITFINAIQKIAVEDTRLGIPLIIGIDHVHGANYVNEGTILPHNLNLSCTWNPDIIAEGATVTAIETAYLGLSWNFAPVLDVGKNSNWPRLYETFGEDPYLCSVFGSTFVKSYQNCEAIAPYKLSACAKHFIGYSDPKSGWDRTPSEIPDQILWEHFIPPFKAAFDAGVKTLMVNSGELNGEPVHGSKRILTDLLRKRLAFDGVIVTDIKDIMKIVEMHGGANDEKEATLLSINAGIDMYMACNSYAFTEYMKELIAEKKITEERVNESVRRILKLKYDLGLFDNPYASEKGINAYNSKEHYDVAYKAALESFVLLKNDNILPLDSAKKILLTGFAANSKDMINGPWTFGWQGAPDSLQPKNMNTIFSALNSKYNTTLLELESITNEIDAKKLVDAAKSADAIVLTVGEKPYSEFKGNIEDLTLAQNQLKLIDIAVSTGKPVILVLVEGRPRIITSINDKVHSIIFAGYPGMKGADALADLIIGNKNFSGKLSFTYPKNIGHLTNYYHKKSDKYNALYPFGYGLSYTNFRYSGLSLSDTILKKDKSIEASIYVKNTGNREGDEVIQWYIKDHAGIITRPVKQLKKFEKTNFPAGLEKKITFTINPMEHLSYPNEKGELVLEEGRFSIIVDTLTVDFILQN